MADYNLEKLFDDLLKKKKFDKENSYTSSLLTDKNLLAKNRDHLRQLLKENHKYVFSLIHKFSTNKDEKEYPLLSERKGADPLSIAELMTTKFGAKEQNGLFYFDNAKTLVMFCNGMWCGQSPNNIKSLLKYGYPANKIKWYRGGMQNWENLGFNTVK